MSPRYFAAVLAAAFALPAYAEAPTIAKAKAVMDKAAAAFERGDAVEPTPEELLVLETAPVTSRETAAAYRKFPSFVARARALRALRAPAAADCPEAKPEERDPNGCVMSAAKAIAAGFGSRSEQAEAAAGVYLALYLTPKNGTPAEAAAARERALAAMNDPRVSQRSAERMRRVMSQAGALSLPGGGADAGVAGGAGNGRTVEQAIAEARRTGQVSTRTRIAQVTPPTLSQRLAASAEEDARLLELGQDDGTAGTAIGRSVTQVKRVGSQMLSYFTSGDTWRRTGQGALQIVGNPAETIRYMPGAIAEAGKTLWHGVKTDVSNASGEVGNFIENPTPYRGAAVIGSVALAVSNAFVVGGGAKTAVRQGAKTEVLQGVRQAEKLTDGAVFGSLDDSLDFTLTAAKPASESYTTVARQWKRGEVSGADLQARIGVDESVFARVESVGTQRAKDCARYGITTCSIANGTDVTVKQVDAASGRVMVSDMERRMADLQERLRVQKVTGQSTRETESALAEARGQLFSAEVGLGKEYGLSFDQIGSTVREMNLPHRSLGMDPSTLAALKRGETPQGVIDFRRKIDAELMQGKAVMAGLYTSADAGAHSQHAVTILGKGRDSAGRIVYQIYDSNVGRVAQIPADLVKPFSAVVVGAL